MDARNIINLSKKSSISTAFSKYYKDGYKKRVTKFTNNFSEDKMSRLVYTYTNRKYLGIDWPLLEYDVTIEQSNAARDAFVDYLIKQRKKIDYFKKGNR